MKFVHIEQTRGFKQAVRHFGGDKRKARKALRKAASIKWTRRLNSNCGLDGMFIWADTPQGRQFWADAYYNNL